MFPEDFMYQVTREEFEDLKVQLVGSQTDGRGGRQKLPLVFTEQGVNMLSCLMNNDRSIEFSVLAMRAFIRVRQTSERQVHFAERLTNLELDVQDLKQIGNLFGGKDHTTTLYAFQKINKEMGQKALVQESVKEIEDLLAAERKIS